MEINNTQTNQIYGAKRPFFVFVTGGVLSSLGKGIASASIGALLQCYGYRVAIRKFDPYLNVNAGTMCPYEHGEVFVTQDGGEVDMDFGHYERFLSRDSSKNDSITSGKIYLQVIDGERRGAYLGKTIQIIPHVTNVIKDFIRRDEILYDFIICEIGGVVGDIEGMAYIEAIRQLAHDVGRNRVLYIHMGLVPFIETTQEFKTKPLQHSIRELRGFGVDPDIILCRARSLLSPEDLDKIEMFANLPPERILQAIDCESIYIVPFVYHQFGLERAIFKYFDMPIGQNSEQSKQKESNLESSGKVGNRDNESMSNGQNKVEKDGKVEGDNKEIEMWLRIAEAVRKKMHSDVVVNIAIVGKYQKLHDSYKSILEAFAHVEIALGICIQIEWIDATELEVDNFDFRGCFQGIHGILVPGGFGERGAEGMVKAIEYARRNMIPFFGICYGMQLALIEYARNVIGLDNATSDEMMLNSSEFNIICQIGAMHKGTKQEFIELGITSNISDTMRLGGVKCFVTSKTKAFEVYDQYRDNWSNFIGVDDCCYDIELRSKNLLGGTKKDNVIDESNKAICINERHRHRFTFNLDYQKAFEDTGASFGIWSDDGFVEEFELQSIVHAHPFFVSVQFHPEFLSRPLEPHPLFMEFIKHASERMKD